MNKRLLTIAIAAGLSAPFALQAAEVELFGVAHVSINQYDVGPTDGELDLTSNKSNFGFKGSHDLGDGLSVIVKATWQVDYTDNTATGPDTDLLVYERYAGFKGGFGTVKFGTVESAYKQTGSLIDPFWSTRAEMRSTGLMSNALMNGIGVHRSRLTNAVQYFSEDMNGFSVVANYTMAGDAAGENNIGVSLRYKNAGLQAFVDYVAIDDVDAPAAGVVAGESATKVGGAYTMGGTTVALAMEMTEDLVGEDYTQFSVKQKVTEKGTVALSYGQAEPTAANSDVSGWVLGYFHQFDKSAKVYAAYGDQSNDDETTEISGFSLGMVYKF
ncbi:MAG TPA: porin [Gammaproteobacteria bacterium]